VNCKRVSPVSPYAAQAPRGMHIGTALVKNWYVFIFLSTCSAQRTAYDFHNSQMNAKSQTVLTAKNVTATINTSKWETYTIRQVLH